jgi:two-component system chemotaxis response regulator CheB
MGRDGCEGAEEIRRRGGRVFAQDPQSCAVFGMPRHVIEAGIAERVAPR